MPLCIQIQIPFKGDFIDRSLLTGRSIKPFQQLRKTKYLYKIDKNMKHVKKNPFDKVIKQFIYS